MKQLTLLLFTATIYLSGYTQTDPNDPLSPDLYPAYEYTYDEAGNRIKRKFILLELKEAPPELTDMIQAIEEIEEENNTLDETDYNDKVDGRTIAIYPNPTKGQLKLEIGDVLNINQAYIRVTDISGKELFYNDKLETTMLYDLSNQADGMYLMTISINGKRSEWKIIKRD
ncbi:MAG: T9SS type A sorting domain-containing protein [Bacteroidia bacterium]